MCLLNSAMTLSVWGRNCKFHTTPLSRNSQKRLKHKENQTKYRKMIRKPGSRVTILIYRKWATSTANIVFRKKLLMTKEFSPIVPSSRNVLQTLPDASHSISDPSVFYWHGCSIFLCYYIKIPGCRCVRLSFNISLPAPDKKPTQLRRWFIDNIRKRKRSEKELSPLVSIKIMTITATLWHTNFKYLTYLWRKTEKKSLTTGNDTQGEIFLIRMNLNKDFHNKRRSPNEILLVILLLVVIDI